MGMSYVMESASIILILLVWCLHFFEFVICYVFQTLTFKA